MNAKVFTENCRQQLEAQVRNNVLVPYVHFPSLVISVIGEEKPHCVCPLCHSTGVEEKEP